jgi:two-component system sensor histidine kinase VicK
MHDVTALRDLNRFKDQMLHLASHELRKPLSLIIGYLDLIRMDTPADSHIQEFIDPAWRASEQMNSKLDDLLRVERIRSSPLELVKVINFGRMLERVLDSLGLLAGAKGQSVEVETAEHLPDVMVDDVLVREAMENLVGNAVKYTPQGGHIRVTTLVDAERVQFIVEDNGMGIAEQDLPRVFETFYRGKQYVDIPIEGHGLGLSFVKAIIERHGGEVWVESKLGVGSRFGFWLPLYHAPAS